MRLDLHDPPTLVAVVVDGHVQPALLLAGRGARRYVQVSSGAGCNALRWVDAAQLRPAVEQPVADVAGPGRGLPWVRARSGR